MPEDRQRSRLAAQAARAPSQVRLAAEVAGAVLPAMFNVLEGAVCRRTSTCKNRVAC